MTFLWYNVETEGKFQLLIPSVPGGTGEQGKMLKQRASFNF